MYLMKSLTYEQQKAGRLTCQLFTFYSNLVSGKLFRGGTHMIWKLNKELDNMTIKLAQHNLV